MLCGNCINFDVQIPAMMSRCFRRGVPHQRFRRSVFLAKSLSAVVVEDYNKGLLTEPFINQILTIAKDAGLKVLVDPKFDNFFAYTGVTLFKPNLREIEEPTSMKESNVHEIRVASLELKKQLRCGNVW